MDKKKENTEKPLKRSCDTMIVHERLLRTIPYYAAARSESENRYINYLQRGPIQARTGVTVIPVVVHVVYKTDVQNISEEQIKSQIAVLNGDFRKTNPDISIVPTVFTPLEGDARIEFELANKDQNGNPSNGITRTHTNNDSFSGNDGVKSSATGGANAWPADKYLNIWVCKLGGGLLGYAQFPGGPLATDGVVILHSAFGTMGTAAAPFNLGRTATHEIGHWLNLRHIWGDDGTGCSGSDYVNDTPNQGGPNYGAPAFPHISCNNGPNGDLFMDYMDYVDDKAMVMFTAGQIDRMQACLDTDRSSIGYSKPGPSIKFKDDPIPTIKFKDDPFPTIKFRDDPNPSIKFKDDPIPTIKFKDDPIPSIKFKEDPIPSLKFRDDIPQPTLKFIDDGRSLRPHFENGPALATPFVLSTPHHSMAWTRSFPEAAKASMEMYITQITQYEQELQGYAEKEEAGNLTDEEKAQVDILYQEYVMLIQEYQQFLE